MKHPVYLFDLDGTLIDSMPVWTKNMLRVMDKYGADYPENIMEILTPLGLAGSLDYFRNQLYMEFEDKVIISEIDQGIYSAYRDSIPLKDGVLEYLKKMKEAGHSLNVLTASGHRILDICLKRLGVFDIFDNVWSSDDFKTSKSDPDIYCMVAEKLGVKTSDIAFFDDNIGAIKTAKSTGVYTVGMFDETGKGFACEMKKTADVYFETLNNAEEL